VTASYPEPIAYYAAPGPITDPVEHAFLFDGLSHEMSELVRTVQGLLLHVFWAQRYGVTLPDERRSELQLRFVARQLARIRELDGRPLNQARPLERKLVGNCRDFSVMLCAILRHQGVPARARCGFGVYFTPGQYEDHWVCEFWDGTRGQWSLVDAQLDELQRQVLGIPFDPLDVPRDQFLTGGKAWQMCRAGEADPDRFGIFDMHGLGFVCGDLLRDFLSLNKVEILPWDGGWGFLTDQWEQHVETMDRIAALTLAGDAAFSQVRGAYEADSRFRPPADW